LGGGIQSAGNFMLRVNTVGSTTYRMVIGPDIRDLSGNQMDQNGNLKAGEIPADQYTAAFGIQGLRITTSPTGGRFVPGLDHVRLTFNESVNPLTFTADTILSFTGPGGPLTVNSVNAVPFTDYMQYDVTFDPQGTTGSYTMVVAPTMQDMYGNKLDQNGNGVPGEDPADRYTYSFGVSGLSIIASTPALNGFVKSGISKVHVTFNEAVDPSTFTPSQVSFKGPGGGLITVTDISPTSDSDTDFDISFAAQTALGTYTMIIGPNILDFYGNQMDQNGNLIPGETPGDQYKLTFSVSTLNPFYATSEGGVNLVSINQLTGVATTIGSFGYTSSYSGTFTPDGSYWTIVNSYFAAQLAKVDLTTGHATPVGAAPITNDWIIALAADNSGKLFAGSHSGRFYSVDTTTGQFTLIDQLSIYCCSYSFDNSGNLWMVDGSFTLYQLNPATGAVLNSKTMTGLAAGTMSIEVDPSNNFYVATTAFPAQLYSLNPTTGVTTLVGTNLGVNYIHGGAFLRNSGSSATPGTVSGGGSNQGPGQPPAAGRGSTQGPGEGPGAGAGQNPGGGLAPAAGLGMRQPPPGGNLAAPAGNGGATGSSLDGGFLANLLNGKPTTAAPLLTGPATDGTAAASSGGMTLLVGASPTPPADTSLLGAGTSSHDVKSLNAIDAAFAGALGTETLFDSL
jgi:hypothetical protein